MARKKPAEPEALGGGWYRTPDGQKIQGRVAAYKAAGLKPENYSRQKAAAAQHHSNRQAVISDRRFQVAELLRSKVPRRTIAEQLDISMATLHEDITFVRQEWRDGRVDAIADDAILELQSLDRDEYRMRMAMERTPLLREKVLAYDRVLRIMVRRAELLGFDAPKVTAILAQVSQSVHTEQEVILYAGGTTEEYVDTLIQAQGLDPAIVASLPAGDA